jgi:hypothetical protein
MGPVRLFISGIIQGSKREMAVHGQGYRQEIAAAVRRRHPEVEIVDPVQLHPDSVRYDRAQAVQTFLELLDQAGEADLLVAYLPEASLGTALEIWRAYEADKPVFVISPMVNNWMLWATAKHIFPDIAAFAEFVSQGNLAPYIGR